MILFFCGMLLFQKPLDTNPDNRPGLVQETQLLEAADDGRLETVKKLIEAGVAVETTNRYGMTPLFLAARRGHLDVVKYLHSKGASLETKESLYEMSVLSALMADDLEDIAVLAYFLDQNLIPKTGDVVSLIYKDKTASLNLLFERKVPIEDMVQLVYGAAGTGRLPSLKLLMKQVSLNRDQLGTALDYARIADQEAVADFLTQQDETLKNRPPRSDQNRPELLGTYATKRGSFLDFIYKDGLIHLKEETDKPTPLIRGEGHEYHVVGAIGGRFTFEKVNGVFEKVTGSYPGYSFDLTRVDPDALPGKNTARVSVLPAKPPRSVSKQPWPSFRGVGARGVATGQNLPSTWSETENIRWKVRIPGLAHAAPIIWGDTVFAISAENGQDKPTLRIGLYGDIRSIGDLDEQTWTVMAFDAATGKQKWRKVASAGKPKNDRHPKSSHANSTPVTDGTHLVVLLGSQGLFCFDMDGNLKWRKALGLLEGSWFYDEKVQWGHGSSPIIDGDRVFIQVDRARNAFIAAFSLADGKELWRTARNEIPSWSSPTLVKHNGGAELITNGTNAVRSYDPQTGALLWWLDGNSEIAVPTPFEHQGNIVITNGYRPIQPIFVIKPGARGQVTVGEGEGESHPNILWHTQRGGPYLPTPVAFDGLLYVVDNQGTLSCYDLKSGERHYRQRMARGMAVTASPLVVDGLLYVFSEFGDTFVVQTGTNYKLLAQNKIEDSQLASPSVAGGTLYIRGEQYLYAIGRTVKTAAKK